MLMRPKQFQFQCFVLVLFHDVRTSEIKLEIKLFYFSCISPYVTGFRLDKKLCKIAILHIKRI